MAGFEGAPLRGTDVTQANGTAEREAAIEMLGDARKTVGADKAYDSEAFVEGCREINVPPHVAQNTAGRASRIDGRTTPHRLSDQSVRP